MARLNPYERRRLKEQEEQAKRLVLPIVPVVYARINPQDANRVARIRFGLQALKDFPRLASIWAEETKHGAVAKNTAP